jgi:hypothetical protein
MKTIEGTFVKSNEYLILKAEILIRTKEWKEAALALNGIGKHEEIGERGSGIPNPVSGIARV